MTDHIDRYRGFITGRPEPGDSGKRPTLVKARDLMFFAWNEEGKLECEVKYRRGNNSFPRKSTEWGSFSAQLDDAESTEYRKVYKGKLRSGGDDGHDVLVTIEVPAYRTPERIRVTVESPVTVINENKEHEDGYWHADPN